jgi:hypothetical protein
MAKNYIEYTNAPEWVKLYSNKHLYPEVNEVEEWCNSYRRYNLLGIDSAILNQISASLVVSIITVYSLL